MTQPSKRVLYDPPGPKVALVGSYAEFANWCVKYQVALHTVRPLLALHDVRGLGDGLVVLLFEHWWETGGRSTEKEMDRIGHLIENKAEVWRGVNLLDPVVEKGHIIGWQEKA